MLKEEILKIVRRKQFFVVFTIFFVMAILDFLVTCKNYYGIELSWIRSAYACGILNNEVPCFSKQFFTTLFPIMVCIGVSDVYYEEEILGMNSFIHTRVRKKENVRIKIISLLIVTFFMVFIPLMINFILTLTAFPIQGYYCSNTVYVTLVNPEKERILSYLEMFYPYLNIFVHILIRCILGCSLALVAFSISLLNRFNRYIVVFSGMLFYFLYVCFTEMPFATNTVINTNIMAINGYGSIWMIVVFVILCIVISNIFIFIVKKNGTY